MPSILQKLTTVARYSSYELFLTLAECVGQGRERNCAERAWRTPSQDSHGRVLRYDQLGAKRQETETSCSGWRTIRPLGPSGRLWASTGCVTGSKQKKSASKAGEYRM